MSHFIETAAGFNKAATERQYSPLPPPVTTATNPFTENNLEASNSAIVTQYSISL